MLTLYLDMILDPLFKFKCKFVSLQFHSSSIIVNGSLYQITWRFQTLSNWQDNDTSFNFTFIMDII